MKFHSEFISLEYSQFLGALISAILADDLVNDHDNLFEIQQCPLLQLNLKLLDKIVNLSSDNETILTEDFLQEIIHFNNAQVSIIIFPLIVYCYQNIPKLEEELDRLINKTHHNKKSIDSFKIIAIVIFMTIEKKYNYQYILNEINKIIAVNNNSKCQLLENLIQNKLTLIQVEELIQSEIPSLSHQGIYQALYSFLSVSHNWEVSLHRSAQFSQKKQETTVLTGLLLGLHHGYFGIPFHRRNTFERQREKIISQIKDLSQKLVAKWQGKLQK